jgi:acyl carrier protein
MEFVMKNLILDKNETINKIKTIISEITRINVIDLDDAIKIREELGIDSLMGIEIIAKCEKRFNIQIDETKFDSIHTIKDFINYILKLIG